MTWRVALLALTIMLTGASAPAIRDAVGGRDGYRVMGVVVALVIAVGVVGAYVGTRRAPVGAVQAGTGSLADQLRAVAAARDFRLLLTTFVVQALGVGAMLAGVDYTARVVLEREGAATILFVCFVGPALLLTPVWERVGRRIGKKLGYVAASLVLAAGALVLLSARVAPDAVVYLAAGLVGVGYAGAQVFPLAMLPDAAAVDAHRTGENRAGVYTGVWTAGETLGLALGPGVFALVLALGGYVSSTDAAAVQPDSAVTAIVLGFSLLPGLLTLLSLWWLSRYSLTADEVAEATATPGEDCAMTDVLDQLRALQARDLPTKGGRTLAYVYDSGLAEVDAQAREAIAAFADSNGLDPTAFPSLLQMENDLVGFAARLLDDPGTAVGSVTSGGTESCMLAVLTARNARPEVAVPKLVMPTTAHAAFHKAAHYFGVLPVLVDVGADFRPDPQAVAEAIDDDTVLVVVSAPSYAHGVVDPVEEVAAAAHARGVRCHVDACIGGWVLPYVERLGRQVRPWSFAVEGVTSISADLHKYGYTPKGASLLLHRTPELRRPQFFASARWPGYTMLNATMQSTKSGGPLAAAWTVVRSIGDEGYERLTAKVLDGLDRLVAGIEAIDGVRLAVPPDSTLVTLEADGSCDVFTIADEMTARRWYVQPQMAFGGHPPNLHLTLCAVTADHVEELLEALAASVAAAQQAGPVRVDAAVAEIVAALDPAKLTDEEFDGLLAAAGLTPGEGTAALPDRMAEVNTLLDLAAPDLREAVLVAFLDRLLRPTRSSDSWVS
jgi:glutamate/tyrosine decarboxylase-like PLP-dependent enzyme